MIISQRRQVFDGEKVWMPDWMRAPLYLQQGVSCWMAHRAAEISRRQTIYEVVLSSIDEDKWPHLWKLKLTTMDEAGIAERLAEFFEKNDIEILTAESSVHTINLYNSMSFVLSMKKYEHPLDGDHEVLSHVSTRRIEFLELSLLSTIGSQLVFHRNGRPRFELYPMRLYSQLRAETHGIMQSVDDPSLKKGEIRLHDKICAAIAKRCGKGKVFYSGAVDTENRAIRMLFFPGGDKGVVHLQVSAAELSPAVIRQILRHVRLADGNVIRFQIRRSLNANDKTKALQLAGLQSTAESGPGRIDLTYESTIDSMPASALSQRVADAIEQDPDLRPFHVYVTSNEF